MLFSSLIFLYAFLPCTLLAYFLTPRRGKNPVLLLASLLFYAWGEPRYLILILLNILLGFTAGLGIHRFRGRLLGRLFLLTSVAGSLGLLCCFKYGDFFLSAINGALGISLPLWRLALPVGISFYTFQILSYTIDLYRGDVEVQRNPVSFALYVALFPQLIAGPIVRYRDVAQELQERKHSTAMAYEGACRFLVGLGKKVILANNLGLLCQSYRSSADPTVLFAWLSALGFFLQIYYDFSGYSDMAIGLGRILGFHFPENFRYPYCSRSVTEFWRRWHMTLGALFRDYVYIPLGGNRTAKLRWMGNILLPHRSVARGRVELSPMGIVLRHTAAGRKAVVWAFPGQKALVQPHLSSAVCAPGLCAVSGRQPGAELGGLPRHAGRRKHPDCLQGKSVCPAESWRPSDSGRFGGYTLAWAAVPTVVKGSAMDRTPPSGAFAAALHSLSGRRFL